ncbi:hypothetical protein QTP88_001100 [Uroleucon formosanum]
MRNQPFILSRTIILYSHDVVVLLKRWHSELYINGCEFLPSLLYLHKIRTPRDSREGLTYGRPSVRLSLLLSRKRVARMPHCRAAVQPRSRTHACAYRHNSKRYCESEKVVMPGLHGSIAVERQSPCGKIESKLNVDGYSCYFILIIYSISYTNRFNRSW